MFCILDKLINFSINFLFVPRVITRPQKPDVIYPLPNNTPQCSLNLRVYILLIGNSDDLTLYTFSCAVNRSLRVNRYISRFFSRNQLNQSSFILIFQFCVHSQMCGNQKLAQEVTYLFKTFPFPFQSKTQTTLQILPQSIYSMGSYRVCKHCNSSSLSRSLQGYHNSISTRCNHLYLQPYMYLERCVKEQGLVLQLS